ncbi:hypothetical protein [Streptomyces albicerus]|uniref:hypothetical protein n=1 Tax=Streptomyces albicerus TaxID=2569859 RepID=UPI001CED9A91|nr:hypothetical protein [Streptomyces albicerus]
MVGILGRIVAQRSAEEGRLVGAGGGFRAGVGAAEAGVVQEPAHLVVSGDQPGVVADAGADLVDGSLGLQLAQQRRDLQGAGLFEGQLGSHGSS